MNKMLLTKSWKHSPQKMKTTCRQIWIKSLRWNIRLKRFHTSKRKRKLSKNFNKIQSWIKHPRSKRLLKNWTKAPECSDPLVQKYKSRNIMFHPCQEINIRNLWIKWTSMECYIHMHICCLIYHLKNNHQLFQQSWHNYFSRLYWIPRERKEGNLWSQRWDSFISVTLLIHDTVINCQPSKNPKFLSHICLSN